MRRKNFCWLLLLALPLFNAGCKKHNKGSGSLAGDWELRQRSAAMNPEVGKYPAGNGNLVEFKDGNYKIYMGGQVIKSGQFSIIADTSVEESVCLLLPKGQYTSRVVYSDSSANKIFYQVEGDQLTFYSGCYAYDAGHSEVYVRVSSVGPAD